MIQQQTVQQVKQRLDSGESILLLDVRNPDEYAIGHLAGSQLIPLGELPGRVGEIERAPDEPIVVYCHHGVRSIHGGMFLAQQGFTNVVSMAGGIDSWSLEIDPTIRRY